MAETVQAEAIVVDGGPVGSATFWVLARRGVQVVLVEQWELGHQLRSSHGGSRIFRTATFEGPVYVALALRSLELLQQRERGSGEPCLRLTGGLPPPRRWTASAPPAEVLRPPTSATT